MLQITFAISVDQPQPINFQRLEKAQDGSMLNFKSKDPFIVDISQVAAFLYFLFFINFYEILPGLPFCVLQP